MRKPKFTTLSKSFDALLAEKRSLIQKEERVIMKLNKVLEQIGYRVERVKQSGSRETARRRRRTGGRRTPQSSTDRNHMEQGAKRRGRPPLRRVA